MNFKKAEKEDAEKLLALTHNAFLRYAKEVGQQVKGVSETLEDIIYDIEKKYVLLAYKDDELVGATRLEDIENIVYISRLCASDTSSNIGKQLIAEAKRIKADKPLCLHTSTKISSLVGFYYKCGFYVQSVSHKKGYPRGLFVYCNENCEEIDFEGLTKDK
ncbi:MAG: GNAT family N-acetyltransferase [Clostridia bacterium]|nr:GNAT family N-acetyltransferase [Clostridia bacterium]